MGSYRIGTAEYRKLWYQKNAKAVKARSRKRRLEKPVETRTATVQWHAKHPEAQRKYRLKLKYGITVSQVDKMLVLQKNACAICYRTPPEVTLCVDHDHRTKRVRGMLCRFCNHKRVGYDQITSAIIHRRIADYLDSTFDGRGL